MANHTLFSYKGVSDIKAIELVIDNEILAEYEKYYFSVHPKAKKKPIPFPYHESINKWMIMKRPQMNALKQKWKDFICWFIDKQGYTNLHISKCDITFVSYYGNNRKHDVDNSCPKFILDGLVLSGFIDDDSNTCLESLTLKCASDVENPRTTIIVNIKG